MAELNDPMNADFIDRLLQLRQSAEEKAARADAEAALEAIAKESELESDSGGTKILIRNAHIQLGEITEELVIALSEFGVSIVDPTPISKVDAIRRVAVLLWKIRKFVQGLDYEERDICRVILAITKDKQAKGKIFQEPGASEKEILDYFEKRKVEPPQNLAERLADLASREPKVLERKMYDHSGPFFQVVF